MPLTPSALLVTGDSQLETATDPYSLLLNSGLNTLGNVFFDTPLTYYQNGQLLDIQVSFSFSITGCTSCADGFTLIVWHLSSLLAACLLFLCLLVSFLFLSFSSSSCCAVLIFSPLCSFTLAHQHSGSGSRRRLPFVWLQLSDQCGC